MEKVYQEILTLWKEERRSQEIIEIPPDFYTRIADYLSHLETMSKTEKEKDPMISRLFSVRKKRVLFMLQDLIHIRITKIIKTLLNNKEIPKRKLTVEEIKFYKSIENSYNSFLTEIYNLSTTITSIPVSTTEVKEKLSEEKIEIPKETLEKKTEKPSSSEKKEVSSKEEIKEEIEEEIEGILYSYILVIKDFEKQFVGIDLEIYGPFIKDSIVYLPKENAEFLIRTGVAEPVEKIIA